MKKFLFLGALAALLLGTASCANDMEPNMVDDGTVQFTIELPNAIDSRANISDGLTATQLQVAVYKEDGTLLDEVSLLGDDAVAMTNKTATVNFKLVKGLTYKFAFWAQKPGYDAYSFEAATGKVSVDYSKALANVDDGDAFSNTATLTVTGPMTETIYLYRPFAQLNYGDVLEDYAAAEAADIDFKQTQVTVKQVATEFDIMGQTTSATGLEDVTWPAAASPISEYLNVEDVNYKWLSMCYFLVPNDKANVDTELSLLNTAGTEFNKIAVSNVPVEKNHRTNILGNLFTDDVNFKIIIDERFDQPDYNIIMGHLYSWMTAEDINNMVANGGTFVLDEDLDLTEPIVIPDGATVTLNLNGHKIFNTEDIWNDQTYKYELISVEGGNLTINGEGDVIAKENDCYAVSVWSGNLVINGGNYNGNISAVYVYKGQATINGGSFTIQQLSGYNDYRYELNLYDSNGRDGTASIKVYGGKYYQFDPANNLAEGPTTNFLATGDDVLGTLITEQDADGWYVVKQQVTGGGADPGNTPGPNPDIPLP